MIDTALKARLKARIKASGPLSVADYMSACLTDPQHGYYTTRTVFGTKGDFITAPEVSQMFGELIGAFCLSAFEQMGSPKTFNLVELGPGRGVLMSDLLRTAKLRPAFLKATQLTLVEVSSKLKEVQRKTLASSGLEPTFVDSFDKVQDGPLIVVANEFFDALPIHQFMKTPSGWMERCIGLDDNEELVFGIGANKLPTSEIPQDISNAPDGTILETQPIANAVAQQIASRIKNQGGAAIFIDYGYLKSAAGETLQALYKHKYDDVLAHPGEADITAHVNFDALSNACKQAGVLPMPPLEQGEFLLRMGLLERAGALGAGKTHEEQEAIRDSVERLAAPEQMGKLFKVLGITATKDPLPPFDLSSRS
ncbi:MAG: class I SAM-dependent methyltransferase [Rhodobacteraceae bacterium]|nr:class I SAM-dependent methyltransferase [Paracoccaceae bacterium]